MTPEVESGGAERSTIYLRAETAAFLRAREHASFDSRSMLIASVLARYERVVREHMPALSRDEWMCVADILNPGLLGFDAGTNADHVSLLWAEIEDGIRLNQTDAKWSIDGLALTAKARAWSYAEKLAVADVVERLWADSKADWDARLAQWGVLRTR